MLVNIRLFIAHQFSCTGFAAKCFCRSGLSFRGCPAASECDHGFCLRVHAEINNFKKPCFTSYRMLRKTASPKTTEAGKQINVPRNIFSHSSFNYSSISYTEAKRSPKRSAECQQQVMNDMKQSNNKTSKREIVRNSESELLQYLPLKLYLNHYNASQTNH